MLTAEQRELRRHRLGSSDAAAIMGLDPWRNAVDVFWEKAGPEVPDEVKPQYDTGNRLEDVIVQYAIDRLGCEVEQHVYVPRGDIFCANLDARLIPSPEQAVEAKYSGEAKDWGDEGTDEVPERVLVQCQHQAYVADLEVVWVPCLVLGYRAEFRLYRVDRHEELIKRIVEEEEKFWAEHIATKTPPNGDRVPPLKVLKAMRRERNTIDLDDQAMILWADLERAKATARAATKAEDEAKAAVLSLLGDADEGTLPDGGCITYHEQNSPPRCDFKRLRALHAEIYEEFVTQGKHRTLRLKQRKGK